MKLSPKSRIAVLRRRDEGRRSHTSRKFREDEDINEITAVSPEMSKVASIDTRERTRHPHPQTAKEPVRTAGLTGSMPAYCGIMEW